MRRMNKSRVNFKHHGSIPSATDLDQFRGDVTTFFTDAPGPCSARTSRHRHDRPRHQQAALTRIRDAETHASQGDYAEALALMSEALDDLLDDYADGNRAHWSTTSFTFLPQVLAARYAVETTRRLTTSSAATSCRWPLR